MKIHITDEESAGRFGGRRTLCDAKLKQVIAGTAAVALKQATCTRCLAVLERDPWGIGVKAEQRLKTLRHQRQKKKPALANEKKRK
jgi:hypothetical protein